MSHDTTISDLLAKYKPTRTRVDTLATRGEQCKAHRAIPEGVYAVLVLD